MSLTKVIDVPEVEKAVSKLINNWLHICEGYRQVQMRCLSDEVNLPYFARLFELIHEVELIDVEEVARFQVSRGQKVTWSDVRPVENIEQRRPENIIETILRLEKELHQFTIQLSKLSEDKGDLALTAFLNDRVIPRQLKVIGKRANQVRDLKRSEDDEIPFLTERLNVRFEIEELEKRIELIILRKEITDNCRRNRVTERGLSPMIGSTVRF